MEGIHKLPRVPEVGRYKRTKKPSLQCVAVSPMVTVVQLLLDWLFLWMFVVFTAVCAAVFVVWLFLTTPLETRRS